MNYAEASGDEVNKRSAINIPRRDRWRRYDEGGENDRQSVSRWEINARRMAR